MFKDLLTNWDGKYSSKKAIVFYSFLLCAFAFLFELFYNKKTNMEMFYCFIGLAGYSSALSVISNKKITIEKDEVKNDTN